MQEAPKGGGGEGNKTATKKERLRLKAEGEWLYQKVMECKNWTYEIWSYYLREGRKRDQNKKCTCKE